MTPTELVLSKLSGVKRSGKGWISLCPAHDDHNPSLSIDEGRDGRALLCCQSRRCSQGSIVAAMGLTLKDLMPDNRKTASMMAPKPPREKPARTFATAREAIANLEAQHGKRAALWTYYNGNGKPCGAVVRWDGPDGKDIRPIAKIKGGWIIGAMRSPRPLYRLPEIRDADPATTASVTEGEKAAEAARSIGLLATTSAGGSQAAKFTDWSPLAGRSVVVLPDNDEAGEKYRNDVIELLHKLNPPATVRVVELPGLSDHGDIVDWLLRFNGDKQAALAELKQLTDAAPVVETRADSPKTSGAPIIVELADVKPEPVSWLWPGRIALGKLSLIAGDPGLGKSFLTLDIAARVSRGAQWPDRRGETNPAGGVVLLSAEDDPADTIRPRLDAAGADVTRIALLQAVTVLDRDSGTAGEAFFSLATDLAALETAIARKADCRLVIVDPVSAYLHGIDSHVNADVRSVFGPLADLASRRRVAIVAVTHLRKGEGAAIYRAMGSLAFVAAARAVWAVGKDHKDPTGRRRLFLPVKNNISADGTGLAFRLEPADNKTAVIAWHAEPVTTSADEALTSSDRRRGPEPEAQEAAVEWLQERLQHGQKPVKEIREQAHEAGFSWPTLRRAKDALKIRAAKIGFGGSGEWAWRLPAKALTSPSSTNNLSALAEPEYLNVFDPENRGDEGGETTPESKGAQVSCMSALGEPAPDETPDPGCPIGESPPLTDADAESATAAIECEGVL